MEVFLNPRLVVGIQRWPLWVHKLPPHAAEMVESALPRSQSSDGQRGRQSESGLQGTSKQGGGGATEVLFEVLLSCQLLRVS